MTSERLDVVVRRRAGPVLVGAAVLLLAFNLRPAVTSLGAVLDEVRDALGLSATAAGVLTTLPVVCLPPSARSHPDWRDATGHHGSSRPRSPRWPSA